MHQDRDRKWERERRLKPSGEADPPMEDTLEGDRELRDWWGHSLGNPARGERAAAKGDGQKRERLPDWERWPLNIAEREWRGN